MRRLATAFLLLFGVLSAPVHSQPAYPSRPVHIVAPVPPGSPPDVVARVIGEQLARALGQPVIVENRPGASGTIGLNHVAKAAPDGYTLGILSMPVTIVPSLFSAMPFDVVEDLTPVRQAVWAGTILVVRNESPYRSLEDLVAQAKQAPAQLTFASGGAGTPSHLGGELLSRTIGSEIRHVPYKGAPEGVLAVMSGEVTMMFAAAGAVAPHLSSGKLRGIAVPTPMRLAAFPDIPTMGEKGFPDFNLRDWLGVVAPPGTPSHIVHRLSNAIGEVAAAPLVRERFRAMGMDAVETTTPDDFGELVRSETARWAKFVRETGIKGQ
ncbi:Bug family tripartite tricarboxylate transporter substrate binding protein [Variovorax sp. MHTC-1]|uniref:Bug family tripartite tricarboxylate transporter substrate binding protein n=1 Tax=Variovorax sp. MHTC-1 TaxID=2495593 RepID=UPI000F870540|nr:tripartite tricarboxylate transporter substrate binding protein [Variovorax sp. MHTC-1]RST55565.1 tripartite tricarboxylate transporter substrate binding protein [Variovorax sp. MHTC-1]